MYTKICISLMLINNNIYTFISGILVSLSINIFTNLCFEKSSLCDSWFMYLATIAFLFSSALCMFLAAKLSKFQNYIIEKNITDYERKKSIVLDATKDKKAKWVIAYLCTVIMVVVGTGLLVINFLGN